jgi:hypothetical protein
MPKNVTVHYACDKECKGSYRFAPEDEKILGPATIYIGKDKCREYGINTTKGFDLTVTPTE